MVATQGDLNDPQNPFDQPQWYDFDAAIISMALHHIHDPADLLRRLGQRIKHGGSLVVIDWLQQSNPNGPADKNEAHMTKLSEGPTIWPGCCSDDIKSHFNAAGCTDIDIVVFPEPIEAPQEMEGYSRMFMAKAKSAS
jgi:SAM-dependent methyltransferase